MWTLIGDGNVVWQVWTIHFLCGLTLGAQAFGRYTMSPTVKMCRCQGSEEMVIARGKSNVYSIGREPSQLEWSR